MPIRLPASRMATCSDCGEPMLRRGPTHRYCEGCSSKRDMKRKRLWARDNPPGAEQAKANGVRAVARMSAARERGAVANAESSLSIAWDGTDGPELLWQIRIAVPFSYAASKNHIYTMRPQGHVALRREGKEIRDLISARMALAIAGQEIVHNKIWLDIYVQKPNHKGDAVNVVDLVCDALKQCLPVDDRWYCIRRLDWQIVRENPRLFVCIGQDSYENCQVCSYCGLIKAFAHFNKDRGAHKGVGRECRECRFG